MSFEKLDAFIEKYELEDLNLRDQYFTLSTAIHNDLYSHALELGYKKEPLQILNNNELHRLAKNSEYDKELCARLLKAVVKLQKKDIQIKKIEEPDEFYEMFGAIVLDEKGRVSAVMVSDLDNLYTANERLIYYVQEKFLQYKRNPELDEDEPSRSI